MGLYNPQAYGKQERTNWTPAPGDKDYQSPWNKGSFEGRINPTENFEELQKGLRIGPLPTHEDPAWAKEKLPMRHFQDGQEHFGNIDPYGFFDQ